MAGIRLILAWTNSTEPICKQREKHQQRLIWLHPKQNTVKIIETKKKKNREKATKKGFQSFGMNGQHLRRRWFVYVIHWTQQGLNDFHQDKHMKWCLFAVLSCWSLAPNFSLLHLSRFTRVHIQLNHFNMIITQNKSQHWRKKGFSIRAR